MRSGVCKVLPSGDRRIVNIDAFHSDFDVIGGGGISKLQPERNHACHRRIQGGAWGARAPPRAFEIYIFF